MRSSIIKLSRPGSFGLLFFGRTPDFPPIIPVFFEFLFIGFRSQFLQPARSLAVRLQSQNSDFGEDFLKKNFKGKILKRRRIFDFNQSALPVDPNGNGLGQFQKGGHFSVNNDAHSGQAGD
jgi:hypothetical protein